MNKVFVSPEAQEDLIGIRRYITEELDNQVAADNLLQKIMQRIRQLEQLADIGSPLSTIVGIETGYRFLVCGHYLVFYRTEQSEVYIDRVLYGRRDYLHVLFGELPQE